MPVGCRLAPRFRAGAMRLEVLLAPAPGALVAGLWLDLAAIPRRRAVLPIRRAVGALVVLLVALLVAPLVVPVIVPVYAPATAAVPGTAIIPVQATLQALATAAVLVLVSVVATAPIQAALPAAVKLFTAAVWAPLAVPTAVTSVVQLIHHIESPVVVTEGRAALQWGHLDYPRPLDHLSSDTRSRTVTKNSEEGHWLYFHLNSDPLHPRPQNKNKNLVSTNNIPIDSLGLHFLIWKQVH